MRTINEIYDSLEIMPGLRTHMFRVAGVANFLIDNSKTELDKEGIITACLLHDLGNLVKVDFGIFPELIDDAEHWKEVQKRHIARYGSNDHEATLKMLSEINVPQKIISYIQAINFIKIKETLDGDTFSQKIAPYADIRVGPYGIITMEERFVDFDKRYGPKLLPEDREKGELAKNDWRELERQIFMYSKVKSEDITDTVIATYIESFKNHKV